jgi:hypothetical protein
MFDLKLTQAKQVTHLLEVAAIDDSLMNQITFLLLCLLGENVAVVSVMSLDLTSSGETESLLGTGVCFNFWHFFIDLVIY